MATNDIDKAEVAEVEMVDLKCHQILALDDPHFTAIKSCSNHGLSRGIPSIQDAMIQGMIIYGTVQWYYRTKRTCPHESQECRSQAWPPCETTPEALIQ